ncbi:MAG: SMI1/KNR4 family protein [Caldilineaceae bacterium]
MWITLIRNLTKEARFHAPVDKEAISHTESALGIKIPDALVKLLNETNGIEGEYGIPLIWSIARIEADNLKFRNNTDFRELYMPFDNLLFFADAGNGDQFAFPIQNGQIQRTDIFVWNHEDDSRVWCAPTLQQYLEWWLTGRLKV